MKRLLIVGCGDHGRVVADAAENCAVWDQICFLDDRHPTARHSGNWRVIGSSDIETLDTLRDDEFLVGIANPKTRIRILDSLLLAGRRIATVVHPSATLSRYATVGCGSVLLANTCVNIAARLERGVIVNTGATVDHDCTIGEGAHICPGVHLAGNVKVGRLAWIGIGTSVRDGIVIGEGTTIGAGAAVVGNIPANCIAVGVPAKVRSSF